MSLSSTRSFTDHIFQPLAVFIEGVEVPYISGSVTQSDGTLPSASLQVPPAPGILDIGKFYQPKLHIFFLDVIDGTEKYRLLFEGYITGSSYTKSIDGKSEYVQFECAHKYRLMQEFLIDYTGFLDVSSVNQTNGSLKVTDFSSKNQILNALSGVTAYNSAQEVTASNPDGDFKVVPQVLKDSYDRVKGVPGMIVNYWQQLKKAGFSPDLIKFQDTFVYIYHPLIENGLKFFQRISGHPMLESMIENGKVDYTCGTDGGTRQVIVPPANKIFLTSAVQVDMTMGQLGNYLQTSGEITNIYQIFSQFFEAIDYHMITLGSPAESTGLTDPTATYAVDTLISPRMPFYYSPSCNVFLPRMYTSINVQSSDDAIPTRIEFINRESPEGENGDISNTYFRGPESIREAIAKALGDQGTLHFTTGPHNGKFGKYEQGRGVKLERGDLPRWLSFLSHSAYANGTAGAWPDKNKDPENYAAMEALSKAWTARYGADKEKLNPWAKDASNIYPHHRMIFSAIDYYYTQSVARNKAGSIQCPFNPYAIPGYPMDIIGSSPNSPSFHAYCVSTTHSFTMNSITTNVSFTSALTYSELVNYYVPFVHPWLQVQLGLATKATIVDNPEGLMKAHEYYNGVLGKDVWAVAPETLYDFSTGLPRPLKRVEGGQLTTGGSATPMRGPNGGDYNPNLTYMGNLTFAYREIESLDSIESREGVKFIPLEASNYNHTAFEYTDSILKDEAAKMELGQSIFLDYPDQIVSKIQ